MQHIILFYRELVGWLVGSFVYCDSWNLAQMFSINAKHFAVIFWEVIGVKFLGTENVHLVSRPYNSAVVWGTVVWGIFTKLGSSTDTELPQVTLHEI